jgi:hypothetical protein
MALQAKILIKSYFNNRFQRVRTKEKYSKNYFSDWEKVKRVLHIGPLFFLLYINHVPGLINDTSKTNVTADNTSIIFTHSNLTKFKEGINIGCDKINNWFQQIFISLNFIKTHYVHFLTRTKLTVNIHKDNLIDKTQSTNFLGFTLDSTQSWKIHIDQPIPRLNSACYIIRFLKSVISTNNLRTIYFSYVHSIIAYGVTFWGNSLCSNIIFKLQNRKPLC